MYRASLDVQFLLVCLYLFLFLSLSISFSLCFVFSPSFYLGLILHLPGGWRNFGKCTHLFHWVAPKLSSSFRDWHCSKVQNGEGKRERWMKWGGVYKERLIEWETCWGTKRKTNRKEERKSGVRGRRGREWVAIVCAATTVCDSLAQQESKGRTSRW